MRLPISLKQLVGLFLVIAALVVAAGPAAISARADNIATFSVTATAACTGGPNTCFSNLVITGTFTIDLTTGIVSGGTMSMTDLADLNSSPVRLPFNQQGPITSDVYLLFVQPNASGNTSFVQLIFPFSSFPISYTGGPLCASGVASGCGAISGAAIGPSVQSPALFAATGGNGTDFILFSGAVSQAPTPAPNPKPMLYPPLPSATAPGGPAFSLTVNGSGFVSGAVVNWDGNPRTTTFVSGNQLTAAITAADIANHGTAVLTVTNPAPGGGTSNAEFFQITNALTATNTTVFGNNEIDAYRVRPSNTVVADFNGDGKLDIAEYANGIIYVLPGNGDGTFPGGGWIESPGPPPPPGGDTTYLAVADLNGDGIPDLIVMNFNGTFIRIGNGNGTFSVAGSLSDVIAFGSIVIADLNGDGFLDLAYVTPAIPAQHVPSAIQVQFGNGDGSFRSGPSTPFVVPNPNTAPGPQVLIQALATGDFNGDGRPDLVVTGVNSSACIAGEYSLLAFPGNGDGTFGSPSQLPGTSTCGTNGGTSVTVADYNGDGKPDVAYFVIEPGFSSPGPSFLDVSLSNGDGTFGIPFQAITQNPLSIGPVLAADLNGDGRLDLVTGNQIFYGNGDGSFTPQGPPQNNGMQVIYAGDFNRDGQVDFLALGSNPNNSSLFDLRTLLQEPAPPDFTGATTSTPQTATPGGTASYAGSVASVNGFTGNVALSATGLPSGVTASFNPATVAGGSGSYTLTLNVGSSVPLGTYTITVTGTSGALTHSATVTLIVNSSLGDFSGAVAAGSDAYQNITAGQSATYTFQLTPSSGFNGNVALTVSGLPAGATASFNPLTVVGGSGTSTLTVFTSSSTPTGSYTLIVTGTSGALSHAGSVFLGVRSDSATFTGSISPASQTITVGQVATYTANIVYLNGFMPTAFALSLSVSGLPPAAQFSETHETVTSSGETDTFTISAPPGTPPGTYTLVLTGSGGGRIRSAAFALTINPAP